MLILEYKVGLNLKSEAKGDETDRGGGDNVTTEAARRGMQTGITERQQPPEAGRRKQGRIASFLELSKGGWPC